MKKFFILLFGAYLSTICNTFAKADITAKHGALYVENATYAEVEKLFKKYGYVEFEHPRLQIPRIYLKTLPTDWKNIEKSDEKNRMFIRIMLPLIMKINEELALERMPVQALWEKVQNGKTLNNEERQFIEKKASEYDIFTINKKNNRYYLLLKELSEKIDELPPAFLIAVAGVYSDWGNSRIATEGNSLYREEVWYSDDGIIPDVPNAEFRYRRFSSLEDGLRSFMHKINSNITYNFVWAARDQSREIGRKVLGEQIITAMSYEGKLKNITGMLDFNLSYYKLNKTDILPKLRDVKP